jgi:hypothetical protein
MLFQKQYFDVILLNSVKQMPWRTPFYTMTGLITMTGK